MYSDWDYVDTWREMQKLLDTGKVKNIGVSNFGIRHLEKLLNDPSCRVVPSVNQYVYILRLHTPGKRMACDLPNTFAGSSYIQETHRPS